MKPAFPHINSPFLLGGRHFRFHPWGGEWIPRLKGLPPPEKPVGESWEFSLHPDFPGTAIFPYEEEISLIDLMKDQGERLLGEAWSSYQKGKVFLAKWIDARASLSVQVHPPADDKAGVAGKAEAWIVADVDKALDPAVYVGFSPEASSQSSLVDNFFTAIEEFEETRPATREGVLEKEAKKILSFLNRIPVKKGEAFLIPPGTIHALGRGVRVFELQQSSDVTYRIWDWNRLGLDGNPRPLHRADARKVLQGPPSRSDSFKLAEAQGNSDGSWERLLSNPGWGLGLNRIRLIPGKTASLTGEGKSFSVLTVLQGPAFLEGDFETSPFEIPPGRSVFIPAGLTDLSISAQGRAEVFHSFIP